MSSLMTRRRSRTARPALLVVRTRRSSRHMRNDFRVVGLQNAGTKLQAEPRQNRERAAGFMASGLHPLKMSGNARFDDARRDEKEQLVVSRPHEPVRKSAEDRQLPRKGVDDCDVCSCSDRCKR